MSSKYQIANGNSMLEVTDLCAHQHSMFHFISIPVLSRDVALLSTPSISCTELCPTFVYKHHLAKQCHGC